MQLGTKPVEEVLGQALENRKEQDKKEINLSLPEWLIDKGGKVIDAVLNFDADTKNEIKTLLCMRHPETGIEPTAFELKQFLTDLPFFAIAVHSAYLEARNHREDIEILYEREEHILMAGHEDKVKNEWFEEFDAGRRQKAGQISKIQIERSMSLDLNVRRKLEGLRKKVQAARSLEETLNKIVTLLDRRSHEIQTILKVEASLNR